MNAMAQFQSPHLRRDEDVSCCSAWEIFEFVFTPKHGSWLNMVEGSFSKMTKQMLRGIRVKAKAELADRIYLYFDEINGVTANLM